ncbi:MAG TPA: hypothetical protein VFL31_00200 [Nitrospiraceae bacterium]|nr:hypothetical protein [Nitrospiraceae bacterium]
MLNIDLIKADALRRLRPNLKQTPSWYQRNGKAKRDEAIRGYLAEIAQAHLTALMDGQVLPPTEELGPWFDGVLSDAVENAGGHADVAAAAEQHRDSLFDIVRAGFLSELDLRQRRWDAAGMGGSMITPEMLAEEEAARRELIEKAIAEGRLLPDGTPIKKKSATPSSPTELPPAPPPLTWPEVSVIFLSDERVQVKRRDRIETFNYAEFGFADGRNGKPDRAWIVLQEFGKRNGVLPKPQPGRGASDVLKDWDIIGKRIQTIRDRLRKHFGITEGDPITFSGTAYQTAFQIGRAPASDF